MTPEQATFNPTTQAKGFGPLPCLRCGNQVILSIDLDDLCGDEACTCNECGEHFSLAEVQAILDGWRDVLAWVALAPNR
jgi:transcription elongation factor Elf1